MDYVNYLFYIKVNVSKIIKVKNLYIMRELWMIKI